VVVGSGPNNPSYDQSVATLVDDIYLGLACERGDVFDLDRIEVLKGRRVHFRKQCHRGSLEHRDEAAGGQLDASGRLLYGQYVSTRGSGDRWALSDVFGARLAVTRNGESGWIDNVNTGRKAPVEE